MYKRQYWYSTKAHPFLQVRLDQAAHPEFTDVCAWEKLTRTTPDVPKPVAALIDLDAQGNCGPPNMTPARVHTLTNWYAIAFLERYLAGDTRYGTSLTTYPPGAHTDVQVTHPQLLTNTETTPTAASPPAR